MDMHCVNAASPRDASACIHIQRCRPDGSRSGRNGLRMRIAPGSGLSRAAGAGPVARRMPLLARNGLRPPCALRPGIPPRATRAGAPHARPARRCLPRRCPPQPAQPAPVSPDAVCALYTPAEHSTGATPAVAGDPSVLQPEGRRTSCQLHGYGSICHELCAGRSPGVHWAQLPRDRGDERPSRAHQGPRTRVASQHRHLTMSGQVMRPFT